MKRTRMLLGALAASLTLVTSSALAEQSGSATEWDGLVRVPSTNIDGVFLAPGADFRAYNKVMIDPTEAAFRRNWQRDYNRSAMDLSSRITDDEAQRMLQTVQSGFQDVFAEEYTKAGYTVVTTPGPDVLRLRTAVINITVSAPDQMSAGRNYSFSGDAGTATLVLEARDSMSGAILGRAVDARTIDDDIRMTWRNRASNRSDFLRVFRRWAEQSASALTRLRNTPGPAAAAVG